MALTEGDIERFKRRLHELRRQITKNVQETTQEALAHDETKGYSQHMADEGTDDFERTISLEVSGTELLILKQIDRALEKIAEQTYGVCDVTGEAIPMARLEAIPYATMTVKAQEKIEKGIYTP
jgi:DnaK suppressor protein